MMRFFAFLFPVLLFGDSLVLRSGASVAGTYVGGDPRSVRFSVGDQIRTYSVRDVIRVVFGSEAAAPAAAISHDSGWRRVSDRPGLGARPEAVTSNSTDKQDQLCELLRDFRDAEMRYVSEPNPIRRADMRKPDPFDWEQRVVAVLGTSAQFDHWTGTVRFHVDGGHVGISFFPVCKGPAQGIEFATAERYVLGSQDSGTMLQLHSPVAQALSQAQANQTVIASGHLYFLPHGSMGDPSRGLRGESRQRYKSLWNNPPASLAFPRYLAAFDAVAVQH